MMIPEDDRVAGRWFPPERGPVLIIGNAGSVFTRHVAVLWRSMGIDARLVTRHWHGERVVAGDVPVIVTGDSETEWQRRSYDWVKRAVWPFEKRLASWQNDRYLKAMGSETSYRPFVAPALADAVGISRLVRTMRPQFVCGQEVFSYGLATAFCRTVPRILMPWGGDIYMYSGTTSLAFRAVRHALRHVDLVVPGSPLASRYLQDRFGVLPESLHVGGLWALDRQLFRRATTAERAHICQRFGIHPAAHIVMNIRRFFPAWGYDLALEAFMRFATQDPAAHFVMLGGGGTETFVARARKTLAERRLLERFTLFDGDIPIEDCAALMSVTDVAVSLMREQDMRPLASILEAAAAGAALVIGAQPEYHAMLPLGFRAALCPPGDVDAAVDAIRRYAADANLRREAAEGNQTYLVEHENGRRQALDLLSRVRQICDRYEQKRGATTASSGPGKQPVPVRSTAS